MNGSLQRYVHFRQMMIRESEAQGLAATPSLGSGAETVAAGQVFERSAVLQETVERVEALRLTLKAVGEAVGQDPLPV